jgi:myo-inositol-1(or 4)-monophosphatase
MGHKPIYAIYSYGSGPMPSGLIKLEEEKCIVRTMGSIALDICMAAQGSFDAVIDSRDKINGYDILAAALILEEAGGVFSLMCGRSLYSLPLDASGLSIVAASDTTIRERIFHELEENGSF